MSGRVSALLVFLARTAKRLGVGEHSYVVGGAVRNHLLGAPIKDLDLVVDSVELRAPRDSGWLARQIQQAIPARSSLVTNNYGVAILTVSESWVLDGHDMRGEILEIANARRESYGGDSGKGYKPHLVSPAPIATDLVRRDFSVNALMWRLADLGNGLEGAPVLDLLESGITDLHRMVLRTPMDPDQNFSDDPTRMLRAVKFMSKYGFSLSQGVQAAIVRNANKLTEMPWDAVRKILVEGILLGPRPRESAALLRALGLNEPLLRLLREEPGFHVGVSRGLAGADTLLLLDLWDLGWHLRGAPTAWVKEGEIPRLREILEANPSAVEAFMAGFKAPPVDQVRLFERHGLQGAARQRVVMKARELLLMNPALLADPSSLEAEVSRALSVFASKQGSNPPLHPGPAGD